MRRLLLIACLLANVSFALVPLGMVHAHFDREHHAAEVHGGHQHDLAPASDEPESRVVDLQMAAFDRGIRAIDWTHWLPLLSLATVLLLAPRLVTSAPRPRAPNLLPASRCSVWPPPLRGPPHSLYAR